MDWANAREEIEEGFRSICARLPEVHEGPAANGRSWLIRRNHFCQVHTVDDGQAELGILIFRSEPPELDILAHMGHPFFKPAWGVRTMGMVIDDNLDWAEVTELVTESYRIQAPKSLAALLERPAD